MANETTAAEKKAALKRARERGGFLARILGLEKGVGGRALKKKKKREKSTLEETLGK